MTGTEASNLVDFLPPRRTKPTAPRGWVDGDAAILDALRQAAASGRKTLTMVVPPEAPVSLLLAIVTEGGRLGFEWVASAPVEAGLAMGLERTP